MSSSLLRAPAGWPARATWPPPAAPCVGAGFRPLQGRPLKKLRGRPQPRNLLVRQFPFPSSGAKGNTFPPGAGEIKSRSMPSLRTRPGYRDELTPNNPRLSQDSAQVAPTPSQESLPNSHGHPSLMLAPLVPRIPTAALTQPPHCAVIAPHTSQGQGPVMQV